VIDAAVTNSVAALQTAVSAAGTLQGALPSVLASVGTAASAALTAIDAQSAQLESTIDQEALGGLVIGMDVPAMVATFIEQTQDALDLSTLQTARGYVARLLANVNNAGAAPLVNPI
jgi:hypothetical protein